MSHKEEILSLPMREFTKEELDQIIVDSYRALLLAREGKLTLPQEREVLPDMYTWGAVSSLDNKWHACLAGCWAIKSLGRTRGDGYILGFIDDLRRMSGVSLSQWNNSNSGVSSIEDITNVEGILGRLHCFIEENECLRSRLPREQGIRE